MSLSKLCRLSFVPRVEQDLVSLGANLAKKRAPVALYKHIYILHTYHCGFS